MAKPQTMLLLAAVLALTATLVGCGGSAVELVDSTAPLVLLAEPLAGATVGGVFPLEVTASDANGVASMSFTFGGLDLGTLIAPPWRVEVDSRLVADGAASLQVRATDGRGNTNTVSWGFTVDNSTPPTFSAWTLADGAWIAGTTNLSVQITSAVGLDRVEWSVDGGGVTTKTLSGSTSTLQIALATTGWSDGSHVLSFTATNLADVSRTETRNVSVDNAVPLVTITDPATDGQVRDVVSLAVTASDTGGSGLDVFEATVDDQVVTMVNGGGSTWTGSWDSRSTADLTDVTLRIVVRDGAGNQASDTRTLTVYNATQDTATAGIPAITGSSLPRSIAAGDLSGSNDGDILVADEFGVIHLFEGSSSFAGGDVSTANRVIDGSAVEGFATAMIVTDLNGDGVPELIVGAPLSDGPAGGRTDCGAVYVFTRDVIAYATGPLGPGDATAILHGPAAYAGLGTSLGAGKFYGDGEVYLAAGAPTLDFATPGEVILAVGSACSGGAIIDTASSFPGRILAGHANGDAFGASVQAFWNTTGTGSPTGHCLAVGASRLSTNGLAFNGAVHFLAPPLPATSSIAVTDLAAPSRIMVCGDGANDYLGTVLSPYLIGGVDSLETVLMGAPSASPDGRAQAGSAYLVDFAHVASMMGDPAPTLSASTVQFLQVNGARAGDRCGMAVVSENVEGDDVQELICGASGANWPVGSSSERTNCGATYVIPLPPGASTGAAAIDLADGDSYSQRIVGPANDALLGSDLVVFRPSAATGVVLLLGCPGAGRVYAR